MRWWVPRLLAAGALASLGLAVRAAVSGLVGYEPRHLAVLGGVFGAALAILLLSLSLLVEDGWATASDESAARARPQGRHREDSGTSPGVVEAVRPRRLAHQLGRALSAAGLRTLPWGRWWALPLAAVLLAEGWVWISYLTSFLEVADAESTESAARASRIASVSVAGVVPLALVIAASEETIYRAPLVVLRRRGWGRTANVCAVLLTAAIFGIVHSEFGLWNVVSAGLAGLLLGAVTVASRSLWPALLAHALYNSTAYLAIVHAA